jgi:hypothetical protein
MLIGCGLSLSYSEADDAPRLLCLKGPVYPTYGDMAENSKTIVKEVVREVSFLLMQDLSPPQLPSTNHVNAEPPPVTT